jgi:hypothetical protein
MYNNAIDLLTNGAEQFMRSAMHIREVDPPMSYHRFVVAEELQKAASVLRELQDEERRRNHGKDTDTGRDKTGTKGGNCMD